ncbi:MAG TPA: hypothetical protein DDE71_03475 [Tenacibaculum sp.]|jgi:heme/copper-type cytochrome/quinol oxidase subunit 3|nr:hypothetical protein [Tenacibaculum sp.]
MEGDFSNAGQSLTITIVLGIYFTAIQLLEYVEAPFTISDSSFGRSFFVATGFHGLHVLVGTLFLMATMIRIKLGLIRPKHHFGFEASAWY